MKAFVTCFISCLELDVRTIFVWPEGIIPNTNQIEIKKFQSLFDVKFNENHLLVIGINSYKKHKDENKFFNTLSIYDHKLNLISDYKKIKLVPFGEFLPFEKVLRKIGLKSLTNNYQSFSSGESRNTILINEDNFNLKILPLICYEIIYSGNIFNNSNFDYILNVSEDGWFGKSIGPKQHFIHSKFRAIENGKYVIRSSNNGMAAIINPLGYIEKKINYGISGYIDLEKIRDLEPTLFSKYGNKIFFTLILLYILFTFSFNRIKNE